MTETDPQRRKRAIHALAGLVSVEESGDGLVEVTVGSFGELRDLRLDPGIGYDRDADALAAKILRTHRAAAARAVAEAATVAAVLLPANARRVDVDVAFDPVLYELDRHLAAPRHDGRPGLGDGIDYAGLRRYVQELRDRAREIRETAESDDGLIAVTVDGHGGFLDLTLDGRIYRAGDTARLARDILATAGRAAARVGDRLTGISAAYAPGRGAA